MVGDPVRNNISVGNTHCYHRSCHSCVIGTRVRSVLSWVPAPMSSHRRKLDLTEQCSAPFFELVALGLLKHSILVLDDATAKTVGSLGGIEFLCQLGVANAVSIESFAAPVFDKKAFCRLDGLRCLFLPPTNDETKTRNLIFVQVHQLINEKNQ